MVSLPPEIINLIVPHIDDDRPLLRSLLSVSRSFRSAARATIFRWLYLTLRVDSTTNNEITHLLDIITGDPTVLKDIRNLVIIFHLEDGSKYDDESPDARPLARDQDFATLLRTISTAPIRRVEFHWNSRFDLCLCSQDILEGLWLLRCSSSLRSLIVSYTTGIPHFLIASVPSEDRLTNLVLDSYEGTHSRPVHFFHPFSTSTSLPSFLHSFPSPPVPNLFNRLTTLKIADPQYFDAVLKAYFSLSGSESSITSSDLGFPSLRTLMVGCRPGLSTHQRRIVQGIMERSPLLEVFSLVESFEHSRSPLRDLIPTQLSKLPHLRKLRIAACAYDSDSNQPFIMAQTLIQAFPLSHLSSLSLTFRWTSQTPSRFAQQTDPAQGGWLELRAALLQIPKLQDLFLNFIASSPTDDGGDGDGDGETVVFNEDGPRLRAIFELLSLDGRVDVRKVVFTGDHWFRVEPSCWEWVDMDDWEDLG